MDPSYLIHDPAEILSPSLIFYRDRIAENVHSAVTLAGSADRLRPHVKTHKTREIVALELAAGITRHKCATIAEAEMLASCGAADVLIAYQLVGPNLARLARLIQNYPATQFRVLSDHPQAARQLAERLAAERLSVSVLLDLDVGMHRTGIPAGPAALELYEQLHHLPGIEPGGLHAYDGHNHQGPSAERQTAASAVLESVLTFRAELLKRGLHVPRVVLGGTPTFPMYAALDDFECSPGTCFLHDHGYGSRYQDLPFRPAALLFTRVISIPRPDRICLDLGHKAVAADPVGDRLVLLDVPDAKLLGQSEEHLVVQTPAAEWLLPGAEVYAIPTHICPTCALHKSAYVVEAGRLVDCWTIAARDRSIGV